MIKKSQQFLHEGEKLCFIKNCLKRISFFENLLVNNISVLKKVEKLKKLLEILFSFISLISFIVKIVVIINEKKQNINSLMIEKYLF